jgi:hypothetical protein
MFKRFIVIFLLLGTFVINAADKVDIADKTAKQLDTIKQAAINYYDSFDFWPQSIDELIVSGYLPTGFSEQSAWGAKWNLLIEGDELKISIIVPESDRLADLQGETEVLDVATRAIKDLQASKKRFALGDRTTAQTAVQQQQDAEGRQAFERGNIEQRAIIKELTITDDENYLKAAETGNPLGRDPLNYLKISATLKDGVVIATDREYIDFNNNINVVGSVGANKFIDLEDNNFVLDPNQISILNELALNKIIDADDEDYFIDIANTSNMQDVQAESLEVNNLFVKKINNNTPITLEELDKYAVTKMVAGDNIKITNASGDDSSIGILTIATVPNPTFESLKVNNDINIGGDLTIGNSTPNMLNSNFVLDGNDAFIAGDLAVEGDIYLDNELIINNATGGELRLGGNKIYNNSFILLQPNADTTNNLKLSSDGTYLTLETTGGNNLNFKAQDNINFQSVNNNTQAFRFNNSTGDAILVIDSVNNKVGVNTASIDNRADFDVEGTLHANEILIEPNAGDIPLKINKNSAGEFIHFNDGTDEFGIYNANGNPEGVVSADIGSIALDTVNGDLYVKRSDGVATNWKIIPNAGTVFIKGGNNFGSDAILGSKDESSVKIITNSKTAVVIGTDQTTTFYGDINLNDNNINKVNNLNINNIQAVDSTLTITLNNLQNDALIIKDDSSHNYLNFNTTTKELEVLTTTTFSTNALIADNVDIGGGTIDGVSIGANSPISFLGVGSLTMSANSINSTNGIIDFGSNELKTSGTVTVGGLNLLGSDLLNLNDFALSSISPSSNTLTININSGLPSAFNITEGANNYLDINTTGSGTITINKTTKLNNNELSGSNFIISGGSIDNVAIGISTPTLANFTTITATTLNSDLDVMGNTLNNVVINSGTLNVSAVTATSVVIGDIIITGNSITSTNDIDFGDTNLKTLGTVTASTIDLSGADLSNLSEIKVNTIKANTDTITIELENSQPNSLVIGTAGENYINFDTNNQLITFNQDTLFTKTLTVNDAIIKGGTITGVAITNLNNLTIGSLTFSTNKIDTTVGNTITFGTNNLITAGTITGKINLDDANLTNLNTIAAKTIKANGANLDLDTSGAVFNIKDNTTNYLTIDNNEITINAPTTFNDILTVDNAYIRGGTITGVAITNLNSLDIGNINITSNKITSTTDTINFDDNNLITAGTITAGAINLNSGNITAVQDIKLKTITSSDNTNITINLGTDSGDDLIIGNNNTLVVEGDNDRVGIGTNAPSTKLDILGNNAAGYITTITNQNTNTNAKGLKIKLANTTPATNSNFIDFVDGTDSIVGSINYNSGTFQVINVSDKKTKTNIENTQIDAQHIISNLRVVDYHRKTNPTGAKITGFIAQEVQKVLPSMVTQVSNNLLGINETTLIPVMIKAMQEQNITLNNLQRILAIDDNYLNIQKAVKINNLKLLDTKANIFVNNLNLKQDIITKNNKLSIKRFDNNKLNNLLTINTTKTKDKNAKGYLSVGDVYLADVDKWATNGISKFRVFATMPETTECKTAQQIGSVGIVRLTQELYVCSDVGWKALPSSVLNTKL